MSFNILNWKHYTFFSQIQALINEKASFVSTALIEKLDFNFVKPLDFVALQDINRRYKSVDLLRAGSKVLSPILNCSDLPDMIFINFAVSNY